MINWKDVIANLSNGSVVTVDPARWNTKNSEYKEMLDLWQSKNFNTSSVRWVNFYDTIHLEEELSSQLKITPLRSWISCVEPGYMTGYHYDIDDNESEYLKHGKIQRFSIFISEPDIGHLFILNKTYYYNNVPGTIVKWNNHREWHNGINGGFTNKYMFHLLGY